MYLLLYFCRIGTNKMLYFALNLLTISFGTAIFDQINMLKRMFTVYYTIQLMLVLLLMLLLLLNYWKIDSFMKKYVYVMEKNHKI